MIMIEAPNPNDSRSAIADWLELRTLVDSRGISTGATLLKILDVLEDHYADPESIDQVTGEKLDTAILEEQRGRLLEIAFSELEYRQKILGESYPFIVEIAAYNGYKIRRARNASESHPGGIVYLFCLLASAIRNKILNSDNGQAGFRLAEQNIPGVFQICSCMAAGGYICGEVSSFGFPRATGTNFMQALRQTYLRFGAGTVRSDDQIPDGYPTSLKDGGIDVIAWLNHPDEMPGKIYILGQCASGANWRQKSACEYITQLHGSWFTSSPAAFATPAMFIPFLLHHDLSEELSGTYLSAVRNKFHFDERQFGIIFDRLRIAHFANTCLSLDEQKRSKIDGADRLQDIQNWVDNIIELVSEDAA